MLPVLRPSATCQTMELWLTMVWARAKPHVKLFLGWVAEIRPIWTMACRTCLPQTCKSVPSGTWVLSCDSRSFEHFSQVSWKMPFTTCLVAQDPARPGPETGSVQGQSHTGRWFLDGSLKFDQSEPWLAVLACPRLAKVFLLALGCCHVIYMYCHVLYTYIYCQHWLSSYMKDHTYIHSHSIYIYIYILYIRYKHIWI